MRIFPDLSRSSSPILTAPSYLCSVFMSSTSCSESESSSLPALCSSFSDSKSESESSSSSLSDEIEGERRTCVKKVV